MILARRSSLAALAVCAAFVFPVSASAATTIDTVPDWDGNSGLDTWAGYITPTFGQVITAPAGDTALDRFTVHMRVWLGSQSGTITYRAYVYEWDGTKATGPAVFTGPAAQTVAVDGTYKAVTIETGGVALTAGNKYVLFLSDVDYPAGTISADWGWTGFGRSVYSDGDAVWSNATDFSFLTAAPWDGNYGGGADFAFTAEFSGGTPADTTAPAITLTTPADNAVYTLNQSVLADYACTDGESTVTQCDGDVADGDAIDTSTVGAHTFTVDTASDGGSDSLVHDYSVEYGWAGFFSPVDNKDENGNYILNKAKAGQAIPVKFSLGGDQGLDIFADGYPTSKVTSCSVSTEEDSIESTVNAGGSSLSYDPTTQRYNYVWKTDKGWANTCRQLVVKLDDGTYHRANFKFTK